MQHYTTDKYRIDIYTDQTFAEGSADNFTTLDGKDTFAITDNYILATDWENRKYKFDFNGQLIT